MKQNKEPIAIIKVNGIVIGKMKSVRVQEVITSLFSWNSFVEFLNHNAKYSCITREQIRKRFRMFETSHNAHETTMDNYRNYLTQAGYLQIVGRGKYKVVNKIPKKKSVAGVFNEAYGTPAEHKAAGKRY